MNLLKVAKDKLVKALNGKALVPAGLMEWHRYCAIHGGIDFTFEEQEDGTTVARSTNFKYGSIITAGRDQAELDRKIEDAILTAFEVPSAYMKEAGIHKVGTQRRYATA